MVGGWPSQGFGVRPRDVPQLVDDDLDLSRIELAALPRPTDLTVVLALECDRITT